jgi:hypothetical protein
MAACHHHRRERGDNHRHRFFVGGWMKMYPIDTAATVTAVLILLTQIG